MTQNPRGKSIETKQFIFKEYPMSIASLRDKATGAIPASQTKMHHRQISPMSLTIGEIKELIDNNPSHPKAIGLRAYYDKYSKVLPASTVVTIDKAVVLGIIDDLAVAEAVVPGATPDEMAVIKTVTGSPLGNRPTNTTLKTNMEDN